MGRKLRAITRTIRRRSGEAKAEVLKLTGETGELLERSIKEARRLAAVARRRARGRGAAAKLKAAAGAGGDGGSLREGRPADQATRSGRAITEPDRVVVRSGRRPIRKGKLGKPTEFGFVSQLAEVTENTKSGARGLILPASTELGNPSENTLLPGTVAELTRLGICPREVALDGGFIVTPTNARSRTLSPSTCSSLAARNRPPSAPPGACGATEPAPRAESVTSNAATGWTDPA